MIIQNFSPLILKTKPIIQLLGKKRKRSKPLDPQYLDIIIAMKEKTTGLVEPKAIYSIFNQNDLPNRPCFEEAEKIGLAICTIGDKLPNEVNNYINNGELVKAVILDAIGSVAIEEIADSINHNINLEGQSMNLEYSTRYSPGYCSWETKDQKLIFDNLSGETIGVHLTNSFMMVPIKSVSFAVNFGKNIATSHWQNRCKYCEQKNECSYKMN